METRYKNIRKIGSPTTNDGQKRKKHITLDKYYTIKKIKFCNVFFTRYFSFR